MQLFSDPVHDDFGSALHGFTPYGGGDIGELEQVAAHVTAGDDGSFYEAFSAFAQRLIDEGAAAEAAGHVVSARACYLRAAVFLGLSYKPLFGTPVDPRLVDGFHLQTKTFDRAMALGDPPAQSLRIPYEDRSLPAYFVRAPRHADEVRPTIVVGGGWDSTMFENFFSIGVAALERGYHVLLHDGPGQGELLIDGGLPLRHDWEHVVTPVVDTALELDLVDPDRLVYYAWSLGGYFAPRVAAFEHRLAAAVADPGQLDVGVKIVDGLRLMGLTDEAAARVPDLDPDFVTSAMAIIESERMLHWMFVRRGFWTNGASDLPSYVAEMLRWKLDPDMVAGITCPMLVTSADNDRASTNAAELYDALTCPKAHVHFTAEEGAGMHCEVRNRSLANRRILDWLDDTVA